MRKLILLALLLTSSSILADFPAGNEILKKVDANFTADNKIILTKMIIHGRRGSRTVAAKSWTRGARQSFSEYLSPAREKGNRMLKLDDQLWTYTPSTDRIIKISGHMLRQSVMGSDLSYEDMMEDPELHKLYTAVVTATDTCLDRDCWVMALTGKTKELAYSARKVWVDKERFLILKEERLASSGRLLKTLTVKKVAWMGGRWVPVHSIFRDELKRSKGTEYLIDDIKFNAKIPAHVFSKASLRR